MPLTKAEKLQKLEGKKVLCGECQKLKVFNSVKWLMDRRKEAICPECQGKVSAAGGLLVTI